jgi:hypothetical protein
VCCDGACVNEDNDPTNCGGCGNQCAATMVCSGGHCTVPTCTGELCAPSSFCCGASCCGQGQLCCETEGPTTILESCYTPTADQPTCPQGCAPLCKSDRNIKKNIAPVDPAAILDQVSRLPISTWTYRDEPTDVRHLGPMAQDFRAAFGLGNDDRTYFAVDAQGVALAAIQALEQRVAEQQKRIEKLERELANERSSHRRRATSRR